LDWIQRQLTNDPAQCSVGPSLEPSLTLASSRGIVARGSASRQAARLAKIMEAKIMEAKIKEETPCVPPC
jgi:hypothetical protein